MSGLAHVPSRLGRPPPGQTCAASANKGEEGALLLLSNAGMLSSNKPAVVDSRDEAAMGSLMIEKDECLFCCILFCMCTM